MAIAKASAGSGFIGAIGYAMQTTKKKQAPELKPVLLVQNNCFGTVSELAGQMRFVADGRQTVKNPVTHLMFALPPGEKAAPEKVMAALDSILADIGVQKDNNQYIVVQHRDKAHDHYHVILNRVGLDGSLLKDNFLNNRLQVAASKVEILQGFQITPNRTRQYNPDNEKGYDYVKRKAPVIELKDQIDKNPVILSAKKEIQAVLRLVIPAVKTLPELKEALLIHGITVSVRENKKGDPTGISYRIDEKVAVKGSAIGYGIREIGKELDLKNQFDSPGLTTLQPIPQAKDLVPAADPVQYIKTHLEEALLTVKNPYELEAALAEKEIKVNFLTNKNGIYGITFEHEGEKIKGTSIGYKWGNVQEKLESNALIPIVLAHTDPTPEQVEAVAQTPQSVEEVALVADPEIKQPVPVPNIISEQLEAVALTPQGVEEVALVADPEIKQPVPVPDITPEQVEEVALTPQSVEEVALVADPEIKQLTPVPNITPEQVKAVPLTPQGVEEVALVADPEIKQLTPVPNITPEQVKAVPLTPQGVEEVALVADPEIKQPVPVPDITPEQVEEVALTPQSVEEVALVADPEIKQLTPVPNITPEQVERSRRLQAMMDKLRVQPPERNERTRLITGNSRGIGRNEEPVADRQPLRTRPESTGADLASLNRNLRTDQDAAQKQRAAAAAAGIAEAERTIAAELAAAAERDSSSEGDEPEPEMEKSRKSTRSKGPGR